MTAIAPRLLPHWILSVVTCSEARKRITHIAKFDGLKMCLFLTLTTYFEIIGDGGTKSIRPEGRRAKKYANAYAADIGARDIRPLTDKQPSKSVSSIADTSPDSEASVRSKLSRIPNEKWPMSRIRVIKIGGTKRFSMLKALAPSSYGGMWTGATFRSEIETVCALTPAP